VRARRRRLPSPPSSPIYAPPVRRRAADGECCLFRAKAAVVRRQADGASEDCNARITSSPSHPSTRRTPGRGQAQKAAMVQIESSAEGQPHASTAWLADACESASVRRKCQTRAVGGGAHARCAQCGVVRACFFLFLSSCPAVHAVFVYYPALPSCPSPSTPRGRVGRQAGAGSMPSRAKVKNFPCPPERQFAG